MGAAQSGKGTAMRFFLRCRPAAWLPASSERFSSSSLWPLFAQRRGTADFLTRDANPGGIAAAPQQADHGQR